MTDKIEYIYIGWTHYENSRPTYVVRYDIASLYINKGVHRGDPIWDVSGRINFRLPRDKPDSEMLDQVRKIFATYLNVTNYHK